METQQEKLVFKSWQGLTDSALKERFGCGACYWHCRRCSACCCSYNCDGSRWWVRRDNQENTRHEESCKSY